MSAKIKEVWDSQADTVPPELLNASGSTVTAPCACSASSLLPALPAVPGEEFQFHSTLRGKFCFWTVEKRQQKCHYSFSFLQTAEEQPRVSMSAFFSLPLERVWMWNAKFGMLLHNSVKHSSVGFLRFPCMYWLKTLPSGYHYGNKLRMLWSPHCVFSHGQLFSIMSTLTFSTIILILVLGFNSCYGQNPNFSKRKYLQVS